MLAIFGKSVATCPDKVKGPNELSNSALKDGFLAGYFAFIYQQSVVADIDPSVVFAHSVKKEDHLRRTMFGVVGDVFCMYQGKMKDVNSLKKRYCLNDSCNEIDIIFQIFKILREVRQEAPKHALLDLLGNFSFILYDRLSKCVMLTSDCSEKFQLFWGVDSEQSLIISDEAGFVSKACFSTTKNFPKVFPVSYRIRFIMNPRKQNENNLVAILILHSKSEHQREDSNQEGCSLAGGFAPLRQTPILKLQDYFVFGSVALVLHQSEGAYFHDASLYFTSSGEVYISCRGRSGLEAIFMDYTSEEERKFKLVESDLDRLIEQMRKTGSPFLLTASSWQPPPSPDVFKVNTEGLVFSEENIIGIGVTIRNSTGQICMALSKKIKGFKRCIHAEELAIVEGLRMAHMNGIRRVLCETTCLKSGWIQPHGAYYVLLRSVRMALLAAFSSSNVLVINRDDNKAAHGLAKYAKEIEDCVVWHRETPPCISDIMSMDSNPRSPRADI